MVFPQLIFAGGCRTVLDSFFTHAGWCCSQIRLSGKDVMLAPLSSFSRKS